MQWFQRKSHLNGLKSQGWCKLWTERGTDGLTDGWKENRTPMVPTAKAGAQKQSSQGLKGTYSRNRWISWKTDQQTSRTHWKFSLSTLIFTITKKRLIKCVILSHTEVGSWRLQHFTHFSASENIQISFSPTFDWFFCIMALPFVQRKPTKEVIDPKPNIHGSGHAPLNFLMTGKTRGLSNKWYFFSVHTIWQH